MVQASKKSSAIFDQKYKPWRRGKSKQHKKHIKQQQLLDGTSEGSPSLEQSSPLPSTISIQGKSLRHRLRGLQRLHQKVTRQLEELSDNNNDDDNDNTRTKIQKLTHQQSVINQQIDELQHQQEVSKQQQLERTRAKASHGVRFLERQKLTRLYHKVKQQQKDSDKELFKIALDQVYVAHFPLDVCKYQRLFGKDGQRVSSYSSHKRAKLRHMICQRLKYGKPIINKEKGPSASSTTSNVPVPRVSWIETSQYDRLPDSWTTEQERQLFGSHDDDKTDTTGNTVDARFATLSSHHTEMLQMAQELEEQLDKQQDNNESDDDDDADPLTESKDRGAPKTVDTNNHNDESDANSDSDDSSSSDSSSESSSSSSSSSSASDSGSEIDNDKKEPNKRRVANEAEEKQEEEQDDFLIDAAASTLVPQSSSVFDNATHVVPGLEQIRGDKSQGWATQRQRPGHYRKQQQQQQQQRNDHRRNNHGGRGNKRHKRF